MDTTVVAASVLTLTSTVFDILRRWLPSTVVRSLLFGGTITDEFKKEFAFNQLLERYKTSISVLNKSIGFNIGFAAIALYAFFVLPPDKSVEVPFIGLEISRDAWLRTAPLIAFGLQIFVFTSFLWFMLSRLGLKMVLDEIGQSKEFADVTDIVLTGAIAHLWIILRIGIYMGLKWNIVWYLPLSLFIIAIVISPLLVSVYFIVELFKTGSFVVAIFYAVLAVPYAFVFVVLLGAATILGMGESSLAAERKIADTYRSWKVILQEKEQQAAPQE